jgi:hypothetical protein
MDSSLSDYGATVVDGERPVKRVADVRKLDNPPIPPLLRRNRGP